MDPLSEAGSPKGEGKKEGRKRKEPLHDEGEWADSQDLDNCVKVPTQTHPENVF